MSLPNAELALANCAVISFSLFTVLARMLPRYQNLSIAFRVMSPAWITGGMYAVLGLGCVITSVYFRLTVRPKQQAGALNWSNNCCASLSVCATSAQSSAYRSSLIMADRVFVWA